MALFTDEELSRILSAHAKGELRRGGLTGSFPNKCCILQAAYGFSNYFMGTYNYEKYYKDACWFDAEYNPGWPLGRFLRELEARGLA